MCSVFPSSQRHSWKHAEFAHLVSAMFFCTRTAGGWSWLFMTLAGITSHSRRPSRTSRPWRSWPSGCRCESGIRVCSSGSHFHCCIPDRACVFAGQIVHLFGNRRSDAGLCGSGGKYVMNEGRKGMYSGRPKRTRLYTLVRGHPSPHPYEHNVMPYLRNSRFQTASSHWTGHKSRKVHE